MLRKLLFLACISFFGITILNSCTTDSNENMYLRKACDCPEFAPYYKLGSSDCFVSKSECETANNSKCEQCK